MADTLFEVPADKIGNPDIVFVEPNFRDMILQNRDDIEHCECYADDGTDYFKIIINNKKNPYSITFGVRAGYEAAIDILKG